MVIVIPGFVVFLIVMFLMSQYLGGDSNPVILKGFWDWAIYLFGAVLIVALVAAFFWYGLFSDNRKAEIIEFYSFTSPRYSLPSDACPAAGISTPCSPPSFDK